MAEFVARFLHDPGGPEAGFFVQVDGDGVSFHDPRHCQVQVRPDPRL